MDFKDVKIREIIPRVFHVEFPNQYFLTSTFLRLQEFYESPYEEIKGNYFSLEKYMDTYASAKGNFTYTADWSGFNVPGNVVVTFFEVFKNNLLEKEKQFYKLLVDYIDSRIFFAAGKFYLIGSVEGNTATKHHEIAHALFYLDINYSSEMLKLNAKNEFADEYKKAIAERGYCDEVLDDELQAFLATWSKESWKKKFNIDVDEEVLTTHKKVFNHFLNRYGLKEN